MIGDVPFPITWLYLRANSNAIAVDLDWATASEVNNDYYSIERSNGNGAWEEIGTVNASNASSNESVYQFIDAKPLSGISDYKVIQHDLNGMENARTVRVHRAEELDVLVAPNPFAGFTTLVVRGSSTEMISLTIVDVQGRFVYSEEDISPGQTVVFGENFAPGLYLVRVNNGRTVASAQVLKR